MVAIEFVQAESGLRSWRDELLSKSEVVSFSCLTSDFHSRSCKGGVEKDTASNVAGSVCAIAALQPRTDKSSANLYIAFKKQFLDLRQPVFDRVHLSLANFLDFRSLRFGS